jgi:hypothetical protein
MGSRCASWCLLSAALVFSRAASAEDIGQEPLSPGQRGAAARGATGSDPAGGSTVPAGPAGISNTAADQVGPPRRHWYGWQTLLADAVPALGLIVVAAQQDNNDSEALVIGFSAAYFVGAPIVHMAHSQFGKAALSLGIRSVGPLLILAGSQDAYNHNGSGGEALVVIGVLAIPAAIAVDAAAIAREDVPRDETGSIVQRLGFAPWFDPKRGGAGLSVGFSL